MLGNVVENLSLIRSDRTLLLNGGEPFSFTATPEHGGVSVKVASNYHGYVIYSRTIHKRIFGEILFFVWIKDGKYARRENLGGRESGFPAPIGRRSALR
jgi:hypothetical protein